MDVITISLVGMSLGPFLIAAGDSWCPRPATPAQLLAGGTTLCAVFAVLAYSPLTSPHMRPGAAGAWGETARVAFAGLAGLGLLLARIDLAVLRLPDVLVLPAYPLVCLLLTLARPEAMPRALAASVACLCGYGLLCGFAGLGFGDVKLGGLLGLALGWVSWGAVLTGAVAGLALGGVHAAFLLVTKRADRRSPVPFGPAMLLGALCGLALS